MPAIGTVVGFLEQIAPLALAEQWDNVGLLVGDRAGEVRKAMACLTITPATAKEAIEAGADLIVAHHPMPFAPVKRLTGESTVGRLLLDLIAARVAVYSAHTAFDSAREGINQRLAAGLGLRGIMPLVAGADGHGTGRWGWLPEPQSLRQLSARLKRFLAIERMMIVGQPEQVVQMVAVGCGAAGELLDAARETGCEAMVLGEARFHTCLEADAWGIGLLLPGHFASERFAMEALAEMLAVRFPDVEVWASRRESDPLRWE